tara:strand:- start:889 stop:1134 length:246 start_codon:yes stop_codon:yes gene_type:complete
MEDKEGRRLSLLSISSLLLFIVAGFISFGCGDLVVSSEFETSLALFLESGDNNNEDEVAVVAEDMDGSDDSVVCMRSRLDR